MTPASPPGRVHLVGAGPGDPGLLTARARELIASADVVLYDRLVSPDALADARPDAELRYVGKAAPQGPSAAPQGPSAATQEEIEELMVRRAREGKVVVRLKGGDPFVFGRGGEEALRLVQAGVPFEVVPGITAGVAAGAYAGIPVTHRGVASAVALVTGHEDPAKDTAALDWTALAAFPGTLVFYMGVRALDRIARELIRAGRAAAQPAAVIERATLPGQRTVLGTLETIAERARVAGVRAPAITLVGDVAALGSKLSWFESAARPLQGMSVAVTRARAQASGLAQRLRTLGASVIEAPAIRVVPRAGPAPDLAAYELVCLTSPNGVDALFARLHAAGADARVFARCLVAAIGPGTARALARQGIHADVVPERFVAEGLVAALDERLRAPAGARGGPPVRRALIARASGARDVLPDALRERGIDVEVLELYDTIAEPLAPRTLAAAREASYVTFTSSSTVRCFSNALDGAALSPATRVVSIGPLTSAALRERGIEPHVEARRHDIDGLIDALLRDSSARVTQGPPHGAGINRARGCLGDE